MCWSRSRRLAGSSRSTDRNSPASASSLFTTCTNASTARSQSLLGSFTLSADWLERKLGSSAFSKRTGIRRFSGFSHWISRATRYSNCCRWSGSRLGSTRTITASADLTACSTSRCQFAPAARCSAVEHVEIWWACNALISFSTRVRSCGVCENEIKTCVFLSIGRAHFPQRRCSTTTCRSHCSSEQCNAYRPFLHLQVSLGAVTACRALSACRLPPQCRNDTSGTYGAGPCCINHELGGPPVSPRHGTQKLRWRLSYRGAQNTP